MRCNKGSNAADAYVKLDRTLVSDGVLNAKK